jgi:HEAT repeat protein
MQRFEDLRHPDHRVRLEAVGRAVRDLGGEHRRLLEVLEPALSDPYPGVRMEAGLALGDSAGEDGDTLERLVALVLAPEGGASRQTCLLGLGRAGLTAPDLRGERWDAARAAALGVADDPDADMRFQALTALTRLMADGPAVLEMARSRVDDDDPEVVGLAAELLAALGDLTSAGRLVERRASLPKEPRRSVLFAAAALGGDGLVKDLLAETGKLPYALRACEALGRLGDPAAVEPLAALLGRFFTHRFIKVAAAAALARLGDARGSRALGKHLKARRRDMRGFAMEQVGRLGLGAHRDALVEVLRDPRDYHSDTAAVALGELGDEVCLAALRAASEDPRQEVREEVERTLRRFDEVGD